MWMLKVVVLASLVTRLQGSNNTTTVPPTPAPTTAKPTPVATRGPTTAEPTPAATRDPITTAEPATTIVVKVEMNITIENKDYTEELQNKSSPQFIKLAADFGKAISKLYEDLPGFKKVEVLEFKKGSLKVAFRVVFEVSVNKPSETDDAKQKIVKNAIGKIAESKGSIGNFKVNTESLQSQVVPQAPRDLQSVDIKTTQISVAWEPPLYHQYYGLNAYIVQYRQHAEPNWKTTTVKTTINYVIKGLKPDTSYVISVLAVNDVGKGVPSNTIEPRTMKDNVFLKIWQEYKWVVVAVGAVLILVIVAGIILCCLRRNRRRRKEKLRESQVLHHQYMNYHDNMASENQTTADLEMADLPKRFKEIPRDQVLFGRPLGSGQFGQVVSGYLMQDKKHCAVKMLKDGASHQDYKDLMNELEIMSSVDEHPNIVNLIGACTIEGPLYVIIELAEHGSLLNYLREKEMTSAQGKSLSLLTKVEKIRIALDVAKGLEHLARHRCVHRDLAARNVLLGTNMTAKLTDFGLARDVYERGFYAHLAGKLKLPVRWMAIEAIETLVATKESDIWSFGVLLWEIESGGKVPYENLQMKQILKTLKEGTRLSKPLECPNEVYAVMMDCWNVDPLKRPTIENLASILEGLLNGARREEGITETSNA